MTRIALSISVAAVLTTTIGRAQGPLSGEVTAAYQSVRMHILKAAEKMPDADYAFKPTPEVRTFGQLIAHVAEVHMAVCGIVKGEPRRGDGASKIGKADLLVALKASNDLCDGVYDAITDTEGMGLVKALGKERPKLAVLSMNVAHDNETYGAIALYLRLKGIVPPSSEGAAGGRP